MTTRRWIDWVNVMLGVWLITSPWLLAVGAGNRPVAWNSWGVGAAIVTLALFSMFKPAVWGAVVGALLGTWLIASPWLLEFANVSTATLNAVIVGMLVVGYALWAMRIDATFGDGTSGDGLKPQPRRRAARDSLATSKT